MSTDETLSRRRLLVLAGLGGIAASLPSRAATLDAATEPGSKATTATGLVLFPLVDTLADMSPSASAARVDFDKEPLETMAAYGLEDHKDQWLLFASMASGKVLLATRDELQDAGFPQAYVDEWMMRTINFLSGGWPCGDQYYHDADCPQDPNSICNGKTTKAPAPNVKGMSYEAAVKLLYNGPAPKAAKAKKLKKGEYQVLGEGFLKGAKVTVKDMAGNDAPGVANPKVTGTFRCSQLTFNADLTENARYKVYVTNVWPKDGTSQGMPLGPADLTG